jgi:hypothetical protein
VQIRGLILAVTCEAEAAQHSTGEIMPKKKASSPDLMTTIARGVGSAVGRITNTAQRLATASSEIVEGASKAARKATRPKPKARKKVAKKAAVRKPKAKAKKKSGRAKA